MAKHFICPLFGVNYRDCKKVQLLTAEVERQKHDNEIAQKQLAALRQQQAFCHAPKNCITAIGSLVCDDLKADNKRLKAALESIVNYDEARRKSASQDSGIVPKSAICRLAEQALKESTNKT